MNIPETFEVTDGHIADGKVEHCRRCPIALAIQEQFNHKDVEVYPDSSLLWICQSSPIRDKSEEFNPHFAKRFLHDKNLLSWIRKFDRYEEVSPITITVDTDKMYFETKGRNNE